MRKLLLIAFASVIACACQAEPGAITISADTGTNTTGSANYGGIAGYVDEIVMVIPSGSSVTGTVAVTATQPQGNSVTLASKEITATTRIRPRFDGTDTAGSALSSDPPGRYLSYGDTLALSVSGANTTGLTWTVWVKYDDAK